MSVKVAIFEDDKDVAELLMEMMESKDFKVTNFYNLFQISMKKTAHFQSRDIFLFSLTYPLTIVPSYKMNSWLFSQNLNYLFSSAPDQKRRSR